MQMTDEERRDLRRALHLPDDSSARLQDLRELGGLIDQRVAAELPNENVDVDDITNFSIDIGICAAIFFAALLGIAGVIYGIWG